jgi:deoxycytidylate deaminase
VDIKALNKVAVAGCYLDGDIFTYNNETYQIRTEIDNTWGLIEENIIYVRLTTKHTVRHAEFNAIGKLTRSSESSTGASVFMTHTPCEQCADLMLMAGIKELYYLDKYRTTEGLIMLEESGVYVEEFTRNS